MEIIKNDRSAKVSFPAVEPNEIISVTFSNAYGLVRFVFGLGAPASDLSIDGDRYIDYDSGLSYEYSDGEWVERGEWFDSSINSINVPRPFIAYCGKFDVNWKCSTEDSFGDEYEEIQQHTVVQPLFTAEELREFDPDFINIDEPAIVRLERTVRAVIERYTGQKFELTYGVQYGRSYNGRSLMLPKRSVSLEDSSGYIHGVRARVDSDGWILRAVNPSSSVIHINANPIYDVHVNHGFKSDMYALQGEWGYRSVPSQIQLAAMLLAQDYGCEQSVWRDRYIEMMKNVDWSIAYNEGAFKGTGNVKVDNILQSYTTSKWAVV